MNADRIDVLAVMDALAGYAERTGAPDRHAPMLREARAAVAELIVATQEYRAAVDGPLDDPLWLDLVARYSGEGNDDGDAVLAGVRSRLAAALAGVGGAP